MLPKDDQGLGGAVTRVLGGCDASREVTEEQGDKRGCGILECPFRRASNLGQIREDVVSVNLATDGIRRAHCLSPRTSL